MRVSVLMLFAAAFGMAQVRIYVANREDKKVTVIDPQTNRVVGEIAVSPNPNGLAASPEGHWLYATSRAKALLDVIVLKTGKRTRGVATGRDPSGLAVAPDTRRVFVCTAPSLDVIDTASLERIKSIFEIKGPCRIETTPDDTRMIAATAGDGMLHVINIRSMTLEFSIAAGSDVHAIAIEGDKNHVIHRLFVAIQSEVEIIDYPSRKVSGRIASAASDLAISPDWKTLWVATGDSVEVYSFAGMKLAGLKKVATVPVGKSASGIVFTPDGKRCFVANTDDNSVSSIDAVAYRELARIPVGKGPDRMVASEWMR
jgi:YVTN family beta-propeller protein